MQRVRVKFMISGTVTKTWVFACADCRQELSVWNATSDLTKARAAIEARRYHSWTHTKDRGWVCPNCYYSEETEDGDEQV